MSDLAIKTTRAEVTMEDLCVELNLPLSAIDKFSKEFKIFPDSEIAQNYQYACSTGTAIVKEMAALTTLDLTERMKSSCFTFSTGGSNDKGATNSFH